MVKRLKTQDWVYAVIFLAPAAILYLIFVVYPTLQLFGFSFLSWDGISPDKTWVGLANYQELLSSDKIFWQAFKNTVIWAMITIFLNVFISFVLAFLMAEPIKFRTYFQLFHFLPAIQAGVVTAVIWRWMYQPNGVINSFLRAIGLDGLARGWLGDLGLALPALAIASAWTGMGVSIVIFLGGIQNIDPSLYEAARVDGAKRGQLFWYVTLPLLRPTIITVLILTLIGAFKAFDIVWATTQGGPIRATELLATYLYKRGMLEVRYGYGCAIAVFLMVVVTLFSIPYLFQQRKEV